MQHFDTFLALDLLFLYLLWHNGSIAHNSLPQTEPSTCSKAEYEANYLCHGGAVKKLTCLTSMVADRWSRASEVCENLNLLMVEIRDKTDFKEMSYMTMNSTWTGLSHSHGNIYRWRSDDKEAGYLEWAPGQPGSAGSDCSEYIKGVGLTGTPCHHVRAFYCENGTADTRTFRGSEMEIGIEPEVRRSLSIGEIFSVKCVSYMFRYENMRVRATYTMAQRPQRVIYARDRDCQDVNCTIQINQTYHTNHGKCIRKTTFKIIFPMVELMNDAKYECQLYDLVEVKDTKEIAGFQFNPIVSLLHSPKAIKRSTSDRNSPENVGEAIKRSTSHRNATENIGEGDSCTKEEYASDVQCNKDGYLEIGPFGLCIRVVEQKKDFNAAHSYCKNHDHAELVRLDDKFDDVFLSHHIQPDQDEAYWIGLSSNNESSVFKWLGDEDEALWFNWDSDTTPDAAGPMCVVKDGYTGTWKQRGCEEKSRFICERISGHNPGQPTIDVTYDKDADVGFVGEALRVTCWSYVPTKMDLNLTVTMASGSIVSSNRYSKYTKDHRFARSGFSCLRLSSASLQLEGVTKDLHNASVHCCWARPDGFTRCAHKKALQILFTPMSPTLDVHLTGDPPTVVKGDDIVATCSGFVGESGNLIWLLSSQDVTTKWQIGLDGTTYVKGETNKQWVRMDGGASNGMTIKSISYEDKSLGPMIISTIRKSASLDMNGAKLSCKINLSGYEKINTADKVETIPWISVISGERDMTSSRKRGEGEQYTFIIFGLLLIFLVVGCACLAIAMGSSSESRRPDSEPQAVKRPVIRGKRRPAASVNFIQRPSHKVIRYDDRHSGTDDPYLRSRGQRVSNESVETNGTTDSDVLDDK